MANEVLMNVQNDTQRSDTQRRSVIILFLLANILYRLLSGAMVVAFTWLLTINTGEKDIYLAIAIIVSFIPAFFVPEIMKNVGLYRGGKRLTCIFIFCMSILMAVVSQIADSPVLVVIGNLLAWLLMLMMEASLDMWYTSMQRSLSELNAHKLSGVVTSSSQGAIMIGPIVLSPLLARIEYSYVFCIFSAFYLFLFLVISLQKEGALREIPQDKPLSKPLKVKLSQVLPLILIWPVIGAFNFMLPLFVRSEGSWGILHLGLLDASFGLGMAFIGLVVAVQYKISNAETIIRLLVPILILAALIFHYGHYNIGWSLAALFLLGAAFGSTRILIRAKIARKYSEDVVGGIISRANRIGVPVLAVSIVMQLMFSNQAWLVPFILSFIALISVVQTGRTKHRPKHS